MTAGMAGTTLLVRGHPLLPVEAHMRRLIAPVLGAVLLLSSAATVSADTTASVDPFGCSIFFGGAQTVEPGPVELRGGWFASTRGQVVSFLQAGTWLITVDGVAVDVKPFLSAPTKVDRKFWEVTWHVPVGSIALGGTMHVNFDLVLKHPNFDGFVHYPKGSVIGGPVTCDITGAHDPV
jgi:hypothetical protein